MTAETVFLFLTICGLLGIFLRQNILNIIVSLMQVGIGISALSSLQPNPAEKNESTIYFLLFFIFILVIFIYAMSVLLIRRRSTMGVNELTEMRG